MTKSNAAAVDPQADGRTWEGWGTTLAWWASRVGGAPEAVVGEYADRLFGPDGLALNIVRYNIGGGENPAYPEHMELRARVPGFKAEPNAEYDWSGDANQRRILRAAMERIAPAAFVAEAFANSPPWWMTASGSVTGNHDAAENLREEDYAAFADYLTTVVRRFREEEGIGFRTLSPFNEPSSPYWTFGNRQEGNRIYPPSQERLIAALDASIREKGLAIGISGPEETSIDMTRDTIASYSEETKALLARFNTHSYAGSDRVGLKEAAGSKPIWNSEHGDGDASGMTLAMTILRDIREMNVTAWVYWQAVENDAGWGMLETGLNDANADLGSYRVTDKYYAYAQWSRFVRPGMRIVGIADESAVAAYDEGGRRLVIVAVNASDAPVPARYDLSAFAEAAGPAAATRTSATERLAPLPALAIEDATLATELPPRSVSTFVVAGVAI